MFSRMRVWNEMKKKKKKHVCARLGIIRTSPRLKRPGSVTSSEGSNSLGVKPMCEVDNSTWVSKDSKRTREMKTVPKVVCGIRIMVSSHRRHMSRATVRWHSQRPAGLHQEGQQQTHLIPQKSTVVGV